MAPLRYRLAERTIDRGDLSDLRAWLRGDPWLTQGPLVREFERSYARWLSVRHAVFVNSGSSANLLMVYALLLAGRLKRGKVVVPAVSWATTVAPVIQLGLTPLLCEAEPRTFGLDPDHLDRLCRRHRPDAVIAVHVLGVPAEIDAILELKRRHGFLLLEDSCAAMGSTYRPAGGRPRRVGTFGEVSTFSFFYGHHLSTIEGGMVCTNDEEAHDLLRLARSHGWPKDLPRAKEARLARARRARGFNRPFTFYVPGFNVRSTDLNARIGLSQMRRIDRVVGRRAENHRAYQEGLRGADGLAFQENPRACIASIAFCALARSPSHRDRIARVLRKNGVETRPVGGGNMSRQPFFADLFGTTPLPVADAIHARGFQLPNHPGLSPEDVGFIAGLVMGAK